MKTNYSKGGISIPVAVIIAGVLIAGTLMFFGRSGGGPGFTSPNTGAVATNNSGAGGVRSITKDDHVRGNSKASVTIVEFSDFECPFCSRLHPTLTQIVENNPDVRWVYRHFPLSTIHSRARGAAVASECIAKLAGNDAFWEFADSLFENQRRLGTSFYEELAQSYGVSADKLNSCAKSKDVIKIVNDDFSEARSLGGSGTPYAVVITKSGSLIPFSGAISYEQIISLVERARES